MIYIILGIGRCGTSALSGLLHNNNIIMTDGIEVGDDNNPKGYYEDSEIKKINEQILNGYAYRNFSLDITKINLDYSLIDKVSDIVKYKSSKYMTWGFKDPRTIFTLPLWIDVLKKYSTKYIIITRNAKSNIKSLMKQNNMIKTYEHGEAIYNLYNDLIFSYDLDALHITYEDLLDRKIEKLNKFIGRSLNYDFIDNTLARN